MLDRDPSVSLEYETTVSARGIAPAGAVVEHIGAADCRFRTFVLFDPGDAVEFVFGSSEKERVVVRGTIVTRVSNGSRFLYVMSLDRMSAREIEALSGALDEYDRSAVEAGETAGSGVDGLTRSSFRVPANFEITFRTPSLDYKPAKAIDISTSGLMMSCAELLVPGVPVELRLVLPNQRSSRELTLGSRVVTRQGPIRGAYLYGLALTCVSDRQRAQLERCVSVLRVSQTQR